MYYTSFGLLAIVIHIIINSETLFRRPRNTVGNTYRAFLWGVMLYYFTDIFWGVFHDLKVIPIIYTDTVLFFLAMVVTVFLWVRYIAAFLDRKDMLSKYLLVSGWLILIFQVIMLFINFFKPIFFSFSFEGEYNPGQARYITLAIQVVIFAFTSVYTMIVSFNSEGSRKLKNRAVGYSGIIMTVFILLQNFFPLVPFYSVGCLLAVCVIHEYVQADERMERNRELGSVKQLAYKDALTQVRNKTAFIELTEEMDSKIKRGEVRDFGIIVLDINDLKKINDTKGHDAGDIYIKDACTLICHQFEHSPVYRIGGDEFVVILNGSDYTNRRELLDSLNHEIERNIREGGVVIAAGMAEYRRGKNYDFNAVMKIADKKMYERKKELKEIMSRGERSHYGFPANS